MRKRLLPTKQQLQAPSVRQKMPKRPMPKQKQSGRRRQLKLQQLQQLLQLLQLQLPPSSALLLLRHWPFGHLLPDAWRLQLLLCWQQPFAHLCLGQLSTPPRLSSSPLPAPGGASRAEPFQLRARLSASSNLQHQPRHSVSSFSILQAASAAPPVPSIVELARPRLVCPPLEDASFSPWEEEEAALPSRGSCPALVSEGASARALHRRPSQNPPTRWALCSTPIHYLSLAHGGSRTAAG
mmetsp:Transcript_48268/g.87047  ORF Transcript_48268/g.87047 Transcript_48268/m.87047 type:complete len:239 (+) Transcript_48268:1112-1828(+)